MTVAVGISSKPDARVGIEVLAQNETLDIMFN